MHRAYLSRRRARTHAREVCFIAISGLAYKTGVRVASLHVYPLKGARGIALNRAEIRYAGIEHDRRFMLIDENGAFITQRSHPRLALVETAIDGHAIVIAGVHVSAEGPRRTVRVWNDDVEAIEVHGDAPRRLSDHLGEPVTLVFMPDDVVRQVDLDYAHPGDRVGFADAFPLLVATQASLDDLNGHLGDPVPMNRFRPNVVVEGAAPWEEEYKTAAWIGSIEVRMPKRCARCNVTLVDQATAERGKEPLKTLAKLRAKENKVYFAKNAIPEAEGPVAVGDPVIWIR
jgi:uncharacterized protein YcbX